MTWRARIDDGKRLALGAVVLTLAALAGCGDGGKDDAADGAHHLRLTPLVARADSVQSVLLAAEPVTAPYAGDLQTYLRLNQGLYDPELRHVAEDSLYTLWRDDLGHFLWIEVAVVNYRFLEHRDVYKELRVAAAGDDPEAAVAQFLFARRKWHSRPAEAVAAFWRADSLAKNLDPLQQLWLQRRLARTESNAGDHEAGIRRLTRQLATVWCVGGPVLACQFWYEIADFSLRRGFLDDALVAARTATACARRSGNAYLEVEQRLLEGRAHDARCEFDAARELFTACEEESRARNFGRWAREAAGRMFFIAQAQGDLGEEIVLLRRTEQFAVAVGDTDGMIKSAAALADVYLQAAQTDSAYALLRRAEFLNERVSTGKVSELLQEVRVKAHILEGNYAAAESLLTAAMTTGRHSVGALQLDIINHALDTQRIDLAIHGLAAADTLGAALFPLYGGQNPAWDLLVIGARVKARQGDFAGARERLGRAAADPAAEEKQDMAWEMLHCRGEVAELAGDPRAAQAAYGECLDLAVAMNDASLEHRSRVLLGQTLVTTGQTSEARALFAASLHTEVYWARLAAALFTGIAWSRDGDPVAASRHFAAVDSLLGPGAPRGLRSRLRLEQARAAAGRGDARQADRYLSDVTILHGGLHHSYEDEIVRAAQRDLARETAEVTASLHWDHPDLAPRKERADRVLDAVAAMIWGPEFASTSLLTPTGPSVVYFLGRERAFVWIGAADRWTWHELPDRRELSRLAQDVATDMEYPDRPVDWAAARELSDRLLAHAHPHWQPGETLAIVPDGELVNLPWAALPWGDQGDELIVDHAPMVIWEPIRGSSTAGGGDPSRGRPILILAADGADGGGSVLREAEVEGRAVADLWAGVGSDLRTAEAARWSGLDPDDLPRYGALHIASHASFRAGAPEYSTLQLTGPDEAPLTLPEIRRLPLRADLVFLSCCETARIGLDRGTGLDSFVRAFLAAGASSVVASAIRVDDAAGRALATDFHRYWLGGKTRAAALRAAQRDVRSSERGWDHPYYWAYTSLHAAAGS